MRVAFYGGSFNPPHLGHANAVETVIKSIKPNKFFIIPDNIPPHKVLSDNSPEPNRRLELCKLAFEGIPGVEVTDIELRRGGSSYTSDTVLELMKLFPGDELCLVVGTDMLLSFETWHRADFLMHNCTIVALAREENDRDAIARHAAFLCEKYNANVEIVTSPPIPMSSSDIRSGLAHRDCREMLNDAVYSEIIKNRYYAAEPNLEWLKEKAFKHLDPKRIPHVEGCAAEAVRLASIWGEDKNCACEAGILHDITKNLSLDEQLILCSRYGIINDKTELENPKLLHAKTGAALAKDLFGISDEIYSAIRWHTTAKPDMTALEKIIYLADYIEPTRDFEGVEMLRRLAYRDLDGAMSLGLKMSLDEIRSYGAEPYVDSIKAYEWYTDKQEG